MNSNTTAALSVLAAGIALGGLAAVIVKVASEPAETAAPSGTRREHRKESRRYRREQRSRIRSHLERA